MTAYWGDHGQRLAELALADWQRYADECAVPLCVRCPAIEPANFRQAMLWRMEAIAEVLAGYDRVLYMDLDVLPRPDAPSLFDLIPPTAVAMMDECAIADDAAVHFRHAHMVDTCHEEGLAIPNSRGRYFNCGVMMLPARAAPYFGPRRMQPEHNWLDQSLVNVRMFAANENVWVLPECFNRLVYWPVLPRRRGAMSYFLHFAGAPDHETRLRDMAAQRQAWQEGKW